VGNLYIDLKDYFRFKFRCLFCAIFCNGEGGYFSHSFKGYLMLFS